MNAYLLLPETEQSRASMTYVKQLPAMEQLSLISLDVLNESRRRPRSQRTIEADFKHTPEPLKVSWRMARELEHRTDPGDIVVCSDMGGTCGVFGLEQAALPPEERREIWTVAADSLFLELSLISATHLGVPMPQASEIDWEIVQYRYSTKILTTSRLSFDQLTGLGVSSELLGASEELNRPLPVESAERWWVPGPVSRRCQTGKILRALTSMVSSVATLGIEDEPDVIWSGTAWDALRHSRGLLGDRVSRSDSPPDDADVIILGDPYHPPQAEVIALREQGTAVVVPYGSVASSMWPNAPTWTDSDDLVATLGRAGSTSVIVPPRPVAQRESRRSAPSRVSIGIPVFEDVRFLSQCLESVLRQTHQVEEILVFDDGSRSPIVSEALARAERLDDRVRVLDGEHRGVCVARNMMLETMTGESFLMIDSDDIIDPTFVEKCLTVLEGDESIWAVATWTRFFGSYEGIEAKPPFDARTALRENPIISTVALVDMRAREAGVRYEPDLAFLYCEDWHFWSQIYAAGGRFGLVPQPLAHHRVHPGSGGHMRTEMAMALGKARATHPLMKLV